MAEILFDWLNIDIKLSKPISSIQEDFSTGYYFAELLHKLGQIPSLTIFRKSNKEGDIIHNFCRLEKTLLDMNIVLNVTDRNKIIAKKKETAMIYLFKIRKYLSSKLVNLDTHKACKSFELHDIYRKLRFSNHNETLLKQRENRIIRQANTNDPYSAIKGRFKHLKITDQDLKIIKEGMDDMKVFEEYHKEIQGLENKRNNEQNNKEATQIKKWNGALSEIRQNKQKLHEESMKDLIFYRDATLNYLSQSAQDTENCIKIFNENLSRMGLDIPGASEVKTGQKVSTDIIMMRMKEVMKQKIVAKKEKEKRDRRRIKEELRLIGEIETRNSKQHTRSHTQTGEVIAADDHKTTVEVNTSEANMGRDVHYTDFYIGDRVGFFKTLIPIAPANDRYEEEYSPSAAIFNKDAFIRSIDGLNYESNLRESTMRQEKKSRHCSLLESTMEMILDLTDEAFEYQQGNQNDLIQMDAWSQWIELFKEGQPIKQIKEESDDKDLNEEKVLYDKATAEFTMKEYDEIFNYVNYLEDWKTSIVPKEVYDKQLDYIEICKDIFQTKIKAGNIEDYEPTENEIDNLTIPKDNVINYPFGEMIEMILEMKYPSPITNEKKSNRFDFLPIKLAFCGYPLSGHKTQAKLINESYPNIKVYSLTNILNEYLEIYERLNKPIEEHPKYKPNKKGLVEQLQEEVKKEREQFASKEQIILPYIEAKALNPDTSPLDSVLINILIEQLNLDFPETKPVAESLNEINAKLLKKKELNAKIEQLKIDEQTSKKPKTKDIQLIQKDIDKLLPELYQGFITVDFPQTKSQCVLIENYFTGYISPIDKPLSHKDIAFDELKYSIDTQPHTPSVTRLQQSGFDCMIELAVSSEEIDRRCNGLRFDPNTKNYYHLEDNPPPVNDKKLNERLIIPTEYANNQMASLKEKYERNINDIRSFYTVFGVEKYNQKTYQIIQAEKKPNIIFEEINGTIITDKMQKFEQLQEEIEITNTLVSTRNAQVQNNRSDSRSPTPNNNLQSFNFSDCHNYLQETDGRSDKKKMSCLSREINYNATYLNWYQFNTVYIQECKAFFWFLYNQKEHIITSLTETQRNFIDYLSNPSLKKELASIYVNKYNTFLEEHGIHKSNTVVKKAFTKDINELNEKLWLMIEKKKNESIENLQQIKDSPIKAIEIDYLYNYAASIFINETRKYNTCIDVLKQYYNPTNITFEIMMHSPESILEGINKEASFEDKLEELYKNCIRILFKQDELLSAMEMKIKHSQSLNESSLSIRKKRKANNSTLNTHFSGDKDINFFDDEIKQIIKAEKDKYKYKITQLKYFLLNYNENINCLFNDVINQLDSWIIISVDAQNNALNELIFHLNDRLRKGESAQLSFELDNYNLYDCLNVREYFYPEDGGIPQKDFAYDIEGFKGLYREMKQYVIAPNIISRRVFIDVFLKEYLTKRKESNGLSKAVLNLSYHAYSNLMRLLNVVIEHSSFMTTKPDTTGSNDPKPPSEFIIEEAKENTDDNLIEIDENDHEEIIEKAQEEDISIQYDTYINLTKTFTILALINTKVIGQKEEKEFRNDLTGKIIKTTQITRDSFTKLDFWWEMDEYLQKQKLIVENNEEEDEEQERQYEEENNAQILAIKELLFDINKDDNIEEDEINIESFINNLKLSIQDKDNDVFQKEYLKDQDERLTYYEFFINYK